TDDVYVIQGARDCAPSPTARLSAARSPGFSRHTPRKVTLVVSRNCLIPLITLATLFAATPALAQELIPFEVTKDKKLTVKVKVEGKERILIVDTGAVDLLLDPSVVGMKPSDLRQKGPWNPNGALKIAERRVVVEIAGKKFGISAAILD